MPSELEETTQTIQYHHWHVLVVCLAFVELLACVVHLECR